MPKIHRKHDIFCLLCGTKSDMLIDGRFCSENCKTTADIKKGSSIFCNNCGASFIAKSIKGRFCHNCYGATLLCECFYPSIKENVAVQNAKRNKDFKRLPMTERFCSDDINTEGLKDYNNRAGSSGLSYGKFAEKELIRKYCNFRERRNTNDC